MGSSNVPVDMYQPLNAQPGNSRPPQSNSMLDTAARECDVVKRSKAGVLLLTWHRIPFQIHFGKPFESFGVGSGREMKNVQILRSTSETEVNNYCGWLRGTSSTRSDGYSNSSGLCGGGKG